jgi:hypothetical protein
MMRLALAVATIAGALGIVLSRLVERAVRELVLELLRE